MKLQVWVCAGVMAGMVSFPAGAEQPAPEEPPAQVVHKPFSVSLLPGISTNGFSSGNVVNNISVGMLATHAGRVDGLAMAMVGNWVDREMRGMELAVGANYAGQVQGTQMAVGLNVAGGAMRGWQSAAGVNVAAGEMVGAQFAAGLNVASGKAWGLQAASGLNIAQELVGVQMSAGLSIAGNLQGAQLSVVNIGGDVSGAQVGIVNVGRRVKGLQLGLINVASEADSSIGLLSFVGNGQQHVQVWGSEMLMTNVALKLGGRTMHTLFTVGLRPGSESRQRLWATGLGVGGHIPVGPFFVDVDVLASSLHTGGFIEPTGHLLGQLRVVAGWQPVKHFAIFGGLTANTLVSFEDEEVQGVDRFKLGRVYDTDRVRVQTWPGLVAGLQI
ncbi:LA_2272 family surface repeat-containing protein [Archangium lansingense]|uniref:LA_2272 family surface repeat-containing protein n=1 Tax=Archangium lansingense TaxID=2995310 RepID=UPI003B78F938